MGKGNVVLKQVKAPQKDCTGIPVALSDATIQQRKDKVLKKMQERGLDQLVIYGDVEHGGNFEYLVGYCVQKGHKSMRYIEKIAASWAEAGITSVKQAKLETANHNMTIYSVMNAFGIGSRD